MSRGRRQTIVCTICGGQTSVVETRTTPDGLRRRRRCLDASCDAKLTTYEIVRRDDGRRGVKGGVVVVKADDLDALLAIAMRLGGIAP